MKKRTVCLVLALTMLLAASVSCAESIVDGEYTLREKLLKQLELSGIRGAMKLEVQGDGSWVRDLEPLSGAMIQLRGVSNGERFEYELYAEKNGQTAAKTVLWGDRENGYFRSELLLDTLLRFPVRQDAVSTIRAMDGEAKNPSCLSAVISLLAYSADLTDVSVPLRRSVETWLDGFALTPETVSDNGDTVLVVRYEVDEASLKAYLKNFMRSALTDEDLLAELRHHMTDEEQNLYLNPGYLWYYDQVIDGLDLSGGAKIERRLTTMGEDRSLLMVLPARPLGYETLTVEWNRTGTVYSVAAEDGTVSLTVSEYRSDASGTTFAGILTVQRKDQPTLAARFRAVGVDTSMTDNEDVTHEVSTWTVEAEPADGNAAAFDPLTVKARFHYYSKSAQRDNTTLEIEVSAALPGGKLALAAKIRSIMPWDPEERSTSGAVDVTGMTQPERDELGRDFVANGVIVLKGLDQPALAADELPATQTDAQTPEPAEETDQGQTEGISLIPGGGDR